LSFLTVMDLLATVFQIPYILVEDESKPFFDKDLRLRILKSVVYLLEILTKVMDSSFVWKQSDVKDLEKNLIPNLENTWLPVFKGCQKSDFCLIQWHMVRYIPFFIRRYGNPTKYEDKLSRRSMKVEEDDYIVGDYVLSQPNRKANQSFNLDQSGKNLW
jgi:hypothetical protein